jgi:molybdate transport system substrate-binding protein
MPFLRLLLFVCISAATSARAESVLVFAAASLSDVLTKLQPDFEQTCGHQVRFNFAASGTLSRQIQEGAPADVYVSADAARMDSLQKAGLVNVDTRFDLAANQLVVVVDKAQPLKLAALRDLSGASFRRIALGDPATVPAGTYAKAALQHAQLWTSVESKLVPLANVRAVLAAVESGNADAGFVYRTDALTSKGVVVAVDVTTDGAPKIVYPAAILSQSSHPAAAHAFMEFLRSEKARATFRQFGFIEPIVP